jgi:hypothetical protein
LRVRAAAVYAAVGCVDRHGEGQAASLSMLPYAVTCTYDSKSPMAGLSLRTSLCQTAPTAAAYSGRHHTAGMAAHSHMPS